MNRVKNPGKNSRLQSKELTDLRLGMASATQTIQDLKDELKSATARVEALKLALDAKDRLREGSLTVNQQKNGLRFTLEVEIRPRSYSIDGRDIGIQYGTAQVALRHHTETALKDIYEVCGNLSTRSTVTVEELPPLYE